MDTVVCQIHLSEGSLTIEKAQMKISPQRHSLTVTSIRKQGGISHFQTWTKCAIFKFFSLHLGSLVGNIGHELRPNL